MSWIDEVKAARARGSFEDAMNILRRELELRPEDPEVHYQMAWTHDALGKERDAVPCYEKAIQCGLQGEELKGAYLGLGSTYRCLGDYEKSAGTFRKALQAFPSDRALETFSSLTLHNQGQHEKAMEILLRQLVETSNDPEIQSYRKALTFYSTRLGETFE